MVVTPEFLAKQLLKCLTDEGFTESVSIRDLEMVAIKGEQGGADLDEDQYALLVVIGNVAKRLNH